MYKIYKYEYNISGIVSVHKEFENPLNPKYIYKYLWNGKIKYKTIGITIIYVITIDKYEIDIAIIKSFLWININSEMNSNEMSKLDIDSKIKIFW